MSSVAKIGTNTPVRYVETPENTEIAKTRSLLNVDKIKPLDAIDVEFEDLDGLDQPRIPNRDVSSFAMSTEMPNQKLDSLTGYKWDDVRGQELQKTVKYKGYSDNNPFSDDSLASYKRKIGGDVFV